MVETNIRILSGGPNLSLPVRLIRVTSTQDRVDVMELACSRLKSRLHLAAVVHPRIPSSLLVVSGMHVDGKTFLEEDWQLTIEDSGDHAPLNLSDELGRQTIPDLVERMLLGAIAKRGRRWVIAGRPRHFYEPDSYMTLEGISGFRRIAVSAFFIENSGVGAACDFQSSFFAAETLAWFFPLGVSKDESSRRRERFDRLALRQRGQGTLLHTRKNVRTVCYFAEAPDGATCGSTGQIRLKGQTYGSLYDYYQATGSTDVGASDRAIKVSFPMGVGSVWVAAKFVRLSIFNDALPRKLETTIHLKPSERRGATLQFWSELGDNTLGSGWPRFESGLWAPPKSKYWLIQPPALLFGKGTELRPSNGVGSYREYWGQRTQTLHNAGCFFVPPTFPRVVHCAHPESISTEAVRALLKDICDWLKKWTGKTIEAQAFPYKNVQDGTAQVLAQATPGLLLFIMNDESNAYATVSTELHERRPKHMNYRTLLEHYTFLREGCWNRRDRRNDMRKGRLKWDAFSGLLAIDLLQLHDGVPWGIQRGKFEGILVIDVGHDRRHYGISLMLCRAEGCAPQFRIETEIRTKTDVKHEAINAEVLRDEIVRLFRKTFPRNPTPLDSLLVLRDGKFCGGELDALEEAIRQLKDIKLIAADARVCSANLAKDSSTQVRLWDVRSPSSIENVPEGTALEITSEHIILANTGGTTLRQGTAEPIALSAIQDTTSGRHRDVADTCFCGAQLNWSQPRMAARLPLPLSRTDEELIKCAQEEVRHQR